jgi:tRNA uridine 5-carboxymethylaminomethyl modification enzyme
MNTQDAMRTLPSAIDAIVVGGGHAGIEAAWALGRCGHRVALITFDLAALARMSCNPAVGGLAKGQLAREIDALGGLIGRLTDHAGIHFRMLNRSKGPAVHAPRAQVDRDAYAREARRRVCALPEVVCLEGEVIDLLLEGSADREQRVVGVRLAPPAWTHVQAGGAHSGGPVLPGAPDSPKVPRVRGTHEILSSVVILTTGTFLDAQVFTGMDARPGGRRGEPPAIGLSAALRRAGLHLGRLKTGTPPRLRRDSIDFAGLTPQPGDEPPPRFSYYETTPVHNRVLCHMTRTNLRTHAVIAGALDRSPLFGGLIRGVGPRHCPSIEDKVVRFPERTSHLVFLEPEGLAGDTIYPNGVSTSLPLDVQCACIRTMAGLENAEIVHPGYAVEYDFLYTSQIDSALRVRGIAGLFAAGQINGTSGYEEAAAQGIMAGLNACAALEQRPALILKRNEAYIGVLVDDLVTKVPTEPYRMFTSQSEYRLLLRQDNADRRLAQIGFERGLLVSEDHRRAVDRWAAILAERSRLHSTRLGTLVAQVAAGAGAGAPREETHNGGVFSARDCERDARDAGDDDSALTLEEYLRRPERDARALQLHGYSSDLSPNDLETLIADIKYEGYIDKLEREIERRAAAEEATIPEQLLDNPPGSLSQEARECLMRHRPRTLGQASRLAGITPCDVSVLAIRIRSLGE